jgi:hypothetical protein
MHGAGMQACRHAWCSLQQAATHNGECLTSLWHRPAIVLHCGDIRSGNKRHHKRHKKRHTTVVHAWVPCRVGYHTGHAQSAVPEGSEGRRPLTAITAAVGDCRLHIACCIRSACLRCCNRCADSAWHRRSHIGTVCKLDESVRTSAAHRRRGCSGVSRLCWSCSAGRTAAPDSRQR